MTCGDIWNDLATLGFELSVARQQVFTLPIAPPGQAPIDGVTKCQFFSNENRNFASWELFCSICLKHNFEKTAFECVQSYCLFHVQDFWQKTITAAQQCLSLDGIAIWWVQLSHFFWKSLHSVDLFDENLMNEQIEQSCLLTNWVSFCSVYAAQYVSITIGILNVLCRMHKN